MSDLGGLLVWLIIAAVLWWLFVTMWYVTLPIIAAIVAIKLGRKWYHAREARLEAPRAR